MPVPVRTPTTWRRCSWVAWTANSASAGKKSSVDCQFCLGRQKEHVLVRVQRHRFPQKQEEHHWKWTMYPANFRGSPF
jgi:hypothetical protein